MLSAFYHKIRSLASMVIAGMSPAGAIASIWVTIQSIVSYILSSLYVNFWDALSVDFSWISDVADSPFVQLVCYALAIDKLTIVLNYVIPLIPVVFLFGLQLIVTLGVSLLAFKFYMFVIKLISKVVF